MKTSALGFSLILLMVPLAGCAGSDTDVNVDISSEELQQMIDDNKDDFFNNTTVVVFQEYYNNTTIVNNNQYDNNYTNNTSNNYDSTNNDYNNYTSNNYNSSNTSNYDQTDSSSSTTNNFINNTEDVHETYVVRLEWDADDYGIMMEEYNPRENNFTYEYTYYDYFTGEYRTDIFTLPCSNFHDVVSPHQNISSQTQYWNDSSYYYDWWDAIHNDTIYELLGNAVYDDDVREVCEYAYVSNSHYFTNILIPGTNDGANLTSSPVFFQLDLPNGTAIKIIQISSSHTSQPERYNEVQNLRTSLMTWTINNAVLSGYSNPCADVGIIVNWNYCDGIMYGGWDDLHLDFHVTSTIYTNSEFTFTMYYELVPVTAI